MAAPRLPLAANPTPAYISSMRLRFVCCSLAALTFGACDASDASTEASTRALTRELHRIDRFARVERQGPHVLRITLHDKARVQPSRAELEALAGAAARIAYHFGSVSPGDSVVVAMNRPRRLGPLIWDGSTRRFTFTSPPEPPPGASRILGLSG